MKEFKNPLVSVIIPTYKRSDYLIRAVDSVINQSYKNIEIIVIDDNFPDSEFRTSTLLKMEKYNDNNQVVYIINESNMGGSLARNIGIENSNGDYITFLDDDDIYQNNKVQNQIRYMSEKDLDMSFTELKLMDNSNKLVDYREYSNLKGFDKISLIKYHLTRHITGTPTFMFKRKYLLSIGSFNDAKMGQEFYLMFKTIEGGGKIGYLQESNVIAYIHGEEKISKGKNKYIGEKILLNFKKNHFSYLSRRDIIFIYFRHHAVMSVTALRNKDFFLLFKHLFLCVIISPYDTLKEISSHVKKISLLQSGN